MGQKASFIYFLGSLLLLSACSLRSPSYNPDLGGFPIYRGTYGDRARMYQGVELKESEAPRSKSGRAKTALLLND